MTTEHTAQALQQQLDGLSSKFASLPIAIEGARIVQDLIASGLTDRSIKQGDKAPDFVLPDVHGENVQLSQLLAKGPVVLIFYRGGWCPFCNLTLRSYQAILPEIERAGATLVAVSPQTPDNSLSASEKMELRFSVLSDSGNTVARAYGLVFTEGPEIHALRQEQGIDLSEINGGEVGELIVPGSYVIAQDGTITLAFVDPDFTHRLEPAKILTALEQFK